MQDIERAVEITAALRQALDEEVARAQGERILIRTFDAPGLWKRAAMREAFNRRLSQLQAQLSEALAATARVNGLDAVTIETLTQIAPAEGQRLAENLAQVRGLAGALSELDALNRHLAERARVVARGYVGALTQTPSAYDRSGQAAAAAASTYSGRV